MRKLSIAAFLFLFSLTCFQACKSSEDSGGGSKGGSTAGTGGTGGEKKEVKPECYTDKQCTFDKFCNQGKCKAFSPEQKEKLKCNADYNCNSDQTGYKGAGYCAKEKEDQQLGVCKRQPALCDPCTADSDCGGDGENKCISYAGGKKFCGKKCGKSACPKGFVCDPVKLQCQPATGSCDEPVKPCKKTVDCPRGKWCRTEVGICIKRCKFDRKDAQSTCSTGTLCHQDGECRKSCKETAECPVYDTGHRRVQLECDDKKRCSVTGCIDSDECKEPDHYCNKKNNKCEPGCEVDRDCFEGKECAGKKCVLLDCIERGGAGVGCGSNQFCCGETATVDKEFSCVGRENKYSWCSKEGFDNPDGTNPLCVDRAKDKIYQCVKDATTQKEWCDPYIVSKGSCYAAPQPFCKRCDPQKNDREKGSAECGGERAGSISICFQSKDNSGKDVGYCGPGCMKQSDCPAAWACAPGYIPCNTKQDPCPKGYACGQGDFPCGEAKQCTDAFQQAFPICKDGKCQNAKGERPLFCVQGPKNDHVKYCQYQACGDHEH